MIQLRQIKKDVFSAYFQIIDTETREIPVKVQGKSETMTAIFESNRRRMGGRKTWFDGC